MQQDDNPSTVTDHAIADFSDPLPSFKEPAAQRTGVEHGQRRSIYLQHLNRLPKVKPLMLLLCVTVISSRPLPRLDTERMAS